MQEIIHEILSKTNNFVWGPPMLILLVGTGIFLTIRLRGLQVRTLGHSLYLAFIKRKESGIEKGDISHFQALMTALAATVGTGNIAGVATAITAGGPGALFWMWITGLFGMATKYSEAVLAVRYRQEDEFGNMSGGPMYYLSKGLKAKWLGVLFALFASVSAFGIGNIVQSNSVADAIRTTFPSVDAWMIGLVLSLATAFVLLGGIKSIGKTTSVIVPFMILIYFAGAMIVVIIHFREIPQVFSMVLSRAFTPTSAIGGFAGALVRDAVRWGVARGVFSNESGLGSAPIAAAAAQTKSPVTQALVSMTQTFIDTIVVCSLTGFVILVSGQWSSGLTGAELTTVAFQTALPGKIGGLIVPVGLVFFAYSTILGWSYYGEKSLQYLLGPKSIRPYRLVFCLMVFVGAIVTKIEIVWSFADIMNGLMAVPNLIGLLGLSGIVVAETRKYFNNNQHLS